MPENREYAAADAHEAERADEVSLLDLLVLVADNSRLLVLAPLAVGVLALVVSSLITPTFTARTIILPPQQQQNAVAAAALAQLGNLANFAGVGLKSPAEQYMSFLRSRTVADRLIDKFDLMQVYEAKLRSSARQALAVHTRIASGKDALIQIEVDDVDPKRAAEIANAYPLELQVLMSSLALTEAQQRRIFFEGQLKQTRGKLAAAEADLSAIGVGAGAIRANPQASIEEVARLRAQVTAEEVRLQSMRSYMTDAASQVQNAMAALAALRAQLNKSEAREPRGPSAGGYIEKYREFKYQEALFEIFVRQFELAKLDESRDPVMVQVVDPAVPPERKSAPKRALIAVVTTLFTAFALFLLLVVRHALATGGAATDERLERIKGGFRRLLSWRRYDVRQTRDR